MAAPDFVVVGHLTLDTIAGAVRPGGAALYAAIAAHRLGLSVGMLTSHAGDFPLEVIPTKIEVVSVAAPQTTAFEHRELDGVRALRVTSAARPLGVADVPADWAEASMVLLAPVFNEVDPRVATAFPDASIGAAAQGWLRGLGPDGAVTSVTWEPPEFLVGSLQALFLSREDIGQDAAGAVEMFQRVPVGVLTAGAEGALLFVNGERYEVPPRPARERDSTGAGDVFAAAFLIDYDRHGNPWDAAALAACAASLSVEGEGVSTIPERAALESALEVYRATE
jgi:sugar/nucleoside kinase (ribokinase family)